ncbi:MAG: VOC family protein [Pseudomonadota bacterium]
MIAYTSVGTNDLDKALAFYDDLLGEIGAKRGPGNERFKVYTVDAGQPMFGICTPYDEKPATAGNGTMITLSVGDKATVERMHAKALALGATCDGEPGPRAGDMFYMAYIRDLDGNKIAFFAPNG